MVLDEGLGTNETLDDCRISFVRHSGRGAHASVDFVRDASTGAVYARETWRSSSGIDANLLQQRVRDEMQTMNKLRHNHIAFFPMMFKDGDTWSIIMLPAADCELRGFLQRCVDANYPRQDIELLDPGSAA